MIRKHTSERQVVEIDLINFRVFNFFNGYFLSSRLHSFYFEGLKIQILNNPFFFFHSKMSIFASTIQVLKDMKKINISIVLLLWIHFCSAQEIKGTDFESNETGAAYIAYGEKIDAEDALNDTQLSKEYATMAVADTLSTTFRATVTDVCKAKGCWMKLQLKDGQEAMVRFKNYGFFMPKDIEGREVVVNGKAFVEEMSVEDQKHYAKDGGQSEAQITEITTPKKTYGFEADGVLLVKE